MVINIDVNGLGIRIHQRQRAFDPTRIVASVQRDVRQLAHQPTIIEDSLRSLPKCRPSSYGRFHPPVLRADAHTG